MATQRNANITSFFQPKDGEKGRGKSMDIEKAISETHEKLGKNDTDDTTTSSRTVTGNTGKGKGKRPLSSPPPNNPIPTKPKPNPPSSPKPSITHLSPSDLPANWLPAPSAIPTTPPSSSLPTSPTTLRPTLTLTTHTGNIFAAPPNALLIHACNTQGSWGAGIALAFRTRYPKAYAIYRAYCLREHDPKTNPVGMGTALLIPPVDEIAVESSSGEGNGGAGGHWIACIFTSAHFGRRKATPAQILGHTGPALEMVLELVRRVDGAGELGLVGEIRMCKINSGLFGVRWEDTAGVVEGIEVREGWRDRVGVWEL